MANQSSTSRIGIGTILFIVFLTLKLAGVGQVAHWSWWWVTSPLWIPLAIIILVMVIPTIIAIIYKSFK